MSKLITVFGATGNQGGSVINEILNDAELSKTYKIRAVTRDPSKAFGKALEAKGVEVVAGDLNDSNSIRNAINGASVVFGVTNYWESMDAALELKQGKAIADAAVDSGVDYLIWSSLPPVKKLTDGKLKEVEHFDSKAAVESYIREKGIPSSFFMPAMFFSNLPPSFRKNKDGSLAYASTLAPDHKVPFIDIAKDTGKFVGAILKNQSAFQGQWVIGASGFYTQNELAATVAKKAGVEVKVSQIPDEVLLNIISQTGNPKAGELVENFKWVRDYGYYGVDSEQKYAETLKLVTAKLSTWEEFVDAKWPFVQ